MNRFGIKAQSRFDYIFNANPTATSNPPVLHVTWLNALTGEVFTCIDNTIDSNVWKSSTGYVISNSVFDGLLYAQSVFNGYILTDSSLWCNNVIAEDCTIIDSTGICFSNLLAEIDIGHVIASDATFTLSCWVKNIGIGLLLAVQNGSDSTGFIRLEGVSNSEVQAGFMSTGGLVELSLTISSTEYTHIIISSDKTTFKAFVAGVLAGSSTVAAVESTEIQHLTLGYRLYTSGVHDAHSNYYLKKLKVYGRALTQEEITSLYNEGA